MQGSFASDIETYVTMLRDFSRSEFVLHDNIHYIFLETQG